MQDKVIAERAKLLSKLSEHIQVERSFPLMMESAIQPELFQELEERTRFFILASLKAHYHHRHFEDRADLLEAYWHEIMGLPNMTPNGVILPKRETCVEFNALHKTLSEVVNSFGIVPQLGLIHLPLTVRFVDGTPNEQLGKRPYASSKLHSDLWSGHFCDALVFIPMMGDIAHTAIEFFEPIGLHETYSHLQKDYLDGHALFKDMRRYDCGMRKQHVYICDTYLLHNTMKTGGGPRVSIDFGVTLAHSAIDEAMKESSERRQNFIPIQDWLEIGTDRMVIEPETFAECAEKYQPGFIPPSVPRYAAQGLRLISLY